jgi:hypothetical protein
MAVISVNLDAIGKCIVNFEASDDLVRYLVHTEVESDFTSPTYRFASQYVTKKVYSVLESDDWDKLIYFLAASQ